MTDVPPDPLPSSVPSEGPCQPWTNLVDARARCNLPVTEVDDAALTFGIQLASLVLWGATGRRYGLCKRTVRPCGPGDLTHGFNSWPVSDHPAQYPPTLATSIHGVATYRSPVPSGCGCTLPTLDLPGPIAFLDPTESVRVNGVILPPASFKIKKGGHNGRRSLIRVDGEGWWCCNDLELDPADPNVDASCPAWEVTYWQGRAIPDEAKDVAGMLAEQFARVRCGGSCDNRLAPGLTKVSRRGVVKEYAPADLKDKETGHTMTGLPAVDAWIAAVNPYRRVRPSAILRADDPERRRIWEFVDAA